MLVTGPGPHDVPLAELPACHHACVGEESVPVFWTQSWVEGEIAKGRLEADGIPVDLRGAAEGPYPVGPAELFVPSRFEAQARRILAQIDSGSDELPDDGGDEAERLSKREQTE